MRRDRSGLVHPVALAAIAVLLVNDHVLKIHAPSALTGKLSDVAGLAFFPLLAAALIGPWLRVDRARVLAACVAATALGFAAIKLWAPATALCAHVLGALQWPLAAGHALLTGEAVGPIQPVAIVRDATDLVALPAVLVAWWIRPVERATAQGALHAGA